MKRLNLLVSLVGLTLIAGCAAPKATPPVGARQPNATPTPTPTPVFHSTTTVTRDELYQNAKVPAHRDYPLSTKIKPCDDFYEYVCSEVKSHFTLPDNRSAHEFVFSDPSERLLAAKKNILAFFQNKPQLTARQKTLKSNYAACLNEPARSKEETQLVAKEVSTIGQLADRQQLQQLMSQRILTPEFSLLGFENSAPDITNKDKYSVYISTGEITLPEKSYYDDAPTRAALKNIFSAFFKTIGKDNFDVRAQNLLDLESKIAKVTPLPSEMRPRQSSASYLVTKPDLKAKYPNLMMDPLLAKIPANIHIVDLTPELTQFMNELLSQGDLETLKDYVLFHSLSQLMEEAYPEYYNVRFQFNNQFSDGPLQRPDLIERCARFVDSKFNFELSAELLSILFSPDTQPKVEAIAEKIRLMKLKEIKETKWISEEGRAGALEKMKKLRLMIFKPKTQKDWNFNADGAVFKDDTYIQNQRSVAMANTWRGFRRLKGNRNHDMWNMSPTTVNAYYSPSDNQFVLPASIFQSPFYVEGAPDYLNTGSIGSVTGHEIGHSIDDQGAKFDANGVVRQWLSDADLVEFHKQADDKLVKLFDHIVVDGFAHDGRLTLGENIGDNVGIHTAYRVAFDGLVGKVAPEKLVQMKRQFFEQYGRLWCWVARPKYVQSLLKTDPHSAGEGRTNGQVVQLDGFYEAFSCKPGDKMYIPPGDRVQIW